MGIQGDEGVWNSRTYERSFTIPICEFTDDVQQFKDELAAIGTMNTRKGNIDTNNWRAASAHENRWLIPCGQQYLAIQIEQIYEDLVLIARRVLFKPFAQLNPPFGIKTNKVSLSKVIHPS